MKIMHFKSYIAEQKATEDYLHELVRLRTGSLYLKRKTLVRLNKQPRNFSINEHALERWNERVGPIAKQEKLTQIINELYKLDRVFLKDNNVGYIDNEILFTFQKDKEKILIDTFYGRMSKKIALLNFEALRKYNAKEGEMIDLTLPEEELKEQIIPQLPFNILSIQYNKKIYLVEKYKTKTDETLIILIIQGSKEKMTMSVLKPNEFMAIKEIQNLPFYYFFTYWLVN